MNIRSFISWLNPVVKFRLLPKNQLRIGDLYRWKSTGNDPYFHLKCRSAPVCGWYMLELKVTSSCGHLSTKLYSCENEQLNENLALCFKVRSNKIFKQVIYFEKPIITLRFDPADHECEFTVDCLSLTKLTPSSRSSPCYVDRASAGF